MEFISGSGKHINTIHDNDYHFYEHLNAVIQEEPLEMIDAETRGLLLQLVLRRAESLILMKE